MILDLISFLITSLSFGYGAFNLFRKKKPLYFQLLICAAGCFALEQLSSIVRHLCDISDPFSIGMLGIFGCNFFLLSANFGTLDKIVDDGTNSKKARILAFLAPILISVLTFRVFLIWDKANLIEALIWVFLLIPSLPASYYNLKHLLLPLDPFGFLKATKLCNFAALGFYLSSILYAEASASPENVICGIFSILMSFTMLILTISAVKGVKKWGI